MLELYGLLAGIVEPICPCFVDHYPETEKKVYPFAEIRFPNVLPNDFCDYDISDFNLLEIDVWDDKGTDITGIEQMTSAIHKELKRLRYSDDARYVSISANTPYRLSLPDPEIHIQRRQLRYVVTVYYKQGE